MYNYIKNNLLDNKYFYLKFLFVTGLILFIINIFLIIIGYYICKWLYKKVHNEYFSIDKYTKYQKSILKKYGKYSVSKIFLVRYNVLSYWSEIPKMLLRMYLPNSDSFLDKRNNMLNHSIIICQININNEIKFISIEKNACLRIRPNFSIRENDIIKSINLDKKWKFKNILNHTKKRIGKKKFFYWHLCYNNCQHWTKEILITLGKYNQENKKFLIQNLEQASDMFPENRLNILSMFINFLNLLL